MDELIQHCLKEIAFEGDLGCSVARLQGFVLAFWDGTQQAGAQRLDDAYFHLVWRSLVRQRGVVVGTVPQGARDVVIAPQKSAIKRKEVPHRRAQPAVPEANSDNEEETSPLTPIATADSLIDLAAHHGNRLRIAVTHDMCFLTITGSHHRPNKLSPMVYTCLQFVTRGRDQGISVMDLGNQTGYDQKTCFYLVKQLLELDLVVKLRRPGVGANFVLHKHFFRRDETWQQIRKESSSQKKTGVTLAGDTNIDPAIISDDSGEDSTMQAESKFDSIDARHLASLALVRSRITKLLHSTSSGRYPVKDILKAIGFSAPSKSDRRFFISRLKELLQEGFIERADQNTGLEELQGATICLGSGSRHVSAIEHIDADVVENAEHLRSTIPYNKTMQWLLVEAISREGKEGVTLHDLHEELGKFDKRNIELHLQRMQRDPPPLHMADLAVRDVMESFGKEHRRRYFTMKGYKYLMDHTHSNEEEPPSTDAQTTVNYFSDTFQATHFYQSYDDLTHFQDHYWELDTGSSKKSLKRKQADSPRKKLGRPRKHPRPEEDDHITVESPPVPRSPKKRGRPCKVTGPNVNDSQNLEGVNERGLETGSPRSRKRRRIDEGSAGETVQVVTPGLRHRVKEILRTTHGERTQSEGEQPCEYPSGKNNLPHTINSPAQSEDAHASPVTTNVDSSASPRRSKRQPKPNLRRDADSVAHRLLARRPPEDVAHAEPSANHDADDSVQDGKQQDVLASPRDIVHGSAKAHSADDVGLAQRNEADHTVPDAAVLPDGHQIASITATTGNLEDHAAVAQDASHGDCAAQSDHASALSNTRREKATRDINISRIRRQNEFMTLLNEAGGIIDLSVKSFGDSHLRLLENFSMKGLPTSAPPGTRVDKRTIESTINRLSTDGKLKLLSATLPTKFGFQRQVKFAYDASISQDGLSGMLAKMGREPRDVAADRQHRNQGESSVNDIVPQADGMPLTDSEIATPTRDPHATLTRSSMLEDKLVISQYYGASLGRVARARALHLCTVAEFNRAQPSPWVVSSDPTSRVIQVPFYWTDLSLQDYCSLVTVLRDDVRLDEAFRNEVDRHLAVKALPREVNTFLQVGLARSRSKIKELLEILMGLRLVTPLQESNPPASSADATSKASRPSFETLDRVSDFPIFWRFEDVAPLWWFASSEKNPPLLGFMEVNNVEAARVYWTELERLCSQGQGSGELALILGATDRVVPPTCPQPLASTLTGQATWTTSYALTTKQGKHLYSFVTPEGRTPLDSKDTAEQRLELIAWEICAPVHAVRTFFQDCGRRRRRALARKRGTVESSMVITDPEQKRAAKKQLMAKSVEARERRQRKWESLIGHLDLSALEDATIHRLQGVQARFMEKSTGGIAQQWQREIETAVFDGNTVKPPLLARPIRSDAENSSPQQSAYSATKSVRQLVEVLSSNIPARGSLTGKVKGRKKRQEAIAEGISHPQGSNLATNDSSLSSASSNRARRQRFQWTQEYDELAQDASVILRSRCRTLRMDWGAVEQLFPHIPRNSVRQRVNTLTQEPRRNAYLRRLEDKWHELWQEYRGSPNLPDENLNSATEFDLIKHIEFLRTSIDKTVLRIGLDANSTKNFNLPKDAHLLETVLIQAPSNEPAHWDLLWGIISDEVKERGLLARAFIDVSRKRPHILACLDVLSRQLAESALKFILSTPNDLYDENKAAAILRQCGDSSVSEASTLLLERAVLAKSVSDPSKKRPGKMLRISDNNQSSLEGPFPKEFFSDATHLDEELSLEMQSWNLLASDGETARLLDMISENEVMFKIDVEKAASARAEVDWNSKKVDDDQLEAEFEVALRRTGVDAGLSQISDQISDQALHQPISPHPNHDGVSVFCAFRSEGITNCPDCVELALTHYATGLREAHQHLVMADFQGLSKRQLANLHIPDLLSLVQSKPPLAYWVGSDDAVLVSTLHIKTWALVIDKKLFLPRRWLTLDGRIQPDIWESACRAVVGTVLARPGICETDLRNRLLHVYDRGDMDDLLDVLGENKVLYKEYYQSDPPISNDLVDEAFTFWFVGSSGPWNLP